MKVGRGKPRERIDFEFVFIRKAEKREIAVLMGVLEFLRSNFMLMGVLARISSNFFEH